MAGRYDNEQLITEFVDYDVQDEDRIARIQAALAEKEKEALEAIKEDICHWLIDVLKPINITPQTFMTNLDTGIALCRLATLIQQAAQEAEKNFVPMEPLSCNQKAESGTFFARDNTSNFISWCRKLGVEEAVIFESDGLVSHKDEKRVILCLLDVARFAEKVGMSAPQLIKMEREIEELEKAEKEEVTQKIDLKTENRSKSLSPSPAKMNSPPSDTNTNTLLDKGTNNKDIDPATKMTHVPRPSKIPRRITRSSVRQGHAPSVSPIRTPTPRVPRKRPREEGESEHQTIKTKRLKRTEKEDNEVIIERKKETMDQKVMRRMGECHCEKRMEVTNCGKGKFIVKAPSGKNITLYARMLSDRVMVRVGGGWDTLDHFLLKHDPLIGPPPVLGRRHRSI